MKKSIISAVLLAGMVASSYGQGTVQAGNIASTDTVNSAATTSGSFWIDLDGTSGANPPILMTADAYPGLNYVLMGGSTAGSMTVVASFINQTVDGNPNLFNGADGVYFDLNGSALPVTGVPSGGTGVFQVFAWEGSQTSFALAQAANSPAGSSPTFSNPVDTGSGPATLDNMPAVVLEVIPEPGTFALAGLGAAALAIFRRRK